MDVLIDYEDALRRFSNRSDFLDIALETWYENEYESIEMLSQSIVLDDKKGMLNYSHSVKGSAANVSAVKVMNIAQQMYEHYQKKEWEEGNALFKALKEAFEETQTEIQNHLNGNK